MLNRDEAQPKSRIRGAGVAYAAAMAIALLLGSPTPSKGAAAATSAGAWPWPLLGEVITPYRNGSDPYAAGQHRGIDIAAPTGTSVRAIVDGRVSFSGRLPDGGQTVTVRTADHLVSSLHLGSRSVRRGDSVVRGQQLGSVGATGKRSAEAPHLHLSVRTAADRRYVDPMSLLGPRRVADPPPEKPAALEPVEKAHARAKAQEAARGGAERSAPAAEFTPSRVVRSARREGRARSGATESRAAPPPLAVEPQADARPVAVPQADPVTRPEAQPATDSRGPRVSRPLLLVVSAICLVALLLRRGARSSGPRLDPAPTSAAEPESNSTAEVIPLHKAS